MATELMSGLREGATTSNGISTKHFHIFRRGISFSISPTIHSAAFRYHGLQHTYDIHETETINESGYQINDSLSGGARVTMSHKLAVLEFCNEQSIHARRIGTINTLVVDHSARKGRIHGDNTDWSGLYALINPHTKSTNSQPMVGPVIGAGGAAGAALYSLHQVGIERSLLANRTIANAERDMNNFEDLLSIEMLADLKSLPESPEVIIGTIPVDMTTEEDFVQLFARDQGLSIDMVYQPRNTPLLMVAKRHEGWRIVPGVDVLIHQAFDQTRIWTGRPSPEEIMEQAVADYDRRISTTTRDR
jgi:shikimate dehydrogenase